MKVRVVKPFKDKHTKVIYQMGQEIEVTKARFEEINSTAHGILAEEIQQPIRENKKEETVRKKSTKRTKK